jgi:hypothetical protein
VGSVRQACTRLGIGALVSLFASLVVLLFLAEVSAVLIWFAASAALALLSFTTAVIAAGLEARSRP